MLNLLRKVRLGRVYLSSNYKDCLNLKLFSQGQLKLTCASDWSLFSWSIGPEHYVTVLGYQSNYDF